jgi:hypothetical protein
LLTTIRLISPAVYFARATALLRSVGSIFQRGITGCV